MPYCHNRNAVTWESCKAVDRNPRKMGGVWCFAGTRNPVAALFEHIDKGSTVAEFVEWFPEVSLRQVHELIEFAKGTLETPPAAA